MTAALAGVLTALKIAGIVLLAVLALALLLVSLVLFVPVRFYLDGEIPETPIGEDFAGTVRHAAQAEAGFHWLFHALRGKIVYPGDLSFTVKLLWKTLTGGADEEEAKQPERADTAAAEAEEQPAAEAGEQHAPEAEKQPAPEAEAVPEEKPEERPVPEARPEKKTEKQPAPDAENRVYGRLADFLIAFSGVISEIFIKPYEVFSKIQYTISRICDKISDVRILLDSESFDAAKAVVCKQLVRLLKGVNPKRCDVRVLYGTGDPALTADILAVYSALYPVLGTYLTPEADFDRRVAGVTAHVRGRITVFRVLWCAGAVYFNRDVRTVYRRAKKLLSGGEESA